MHAVSNESQALLGACKYVMLCLLRRLEGDHPGLIDDLMDEVETDRLSILLADRMDGAAEQIFKQVDDLLAHASSVSRSGNEFETCWRDVTPVATRSAASASSSISSLTVRWPRASSR